MNWKFQAAGTTPAWTHFPLRNDCLVREFETERAAVRAQNRVEFHLPIDGRTVCASSVLGPQASNGFYPAWVLYLDLR